MSEIKKRCFVIQRFDEGRYDRLYEEVFEPAIRRAGFEAYRVDRDAGASVPIDTIEREIVAADACFAELSEDAPNIWFELGLSRAKQKPLCLICSDKREKFPFDIQHRQIISYPASALPTEFAELGRKIEARLRSLVEEAVSQNQNAEIAKALAGSPPVHGLRAHELSALTLVVGEQLSGALTPYQYGVRMEKRGFNGVAASLAVSGLKRKGLLKEDAIFDGNGEPYEVIKITEAGEDWLLDNLDELNLSPETDNSPLDYF